MRWYVNRTGNAEGPWDEPTIVGMIQRGEIQSQHQIVVEGQQNWQPLSTHPAFAQALAGGGAPAAPAAPQAPPAQSSQPGGGGFSPPTGGQVDHAANQMAQGVGGAANQLGNAFGAASGGGLAAPQAAAAGDGFFEKAQASGQMPSEAAKEAAGKGHLFSALGAFLLFCICGLGGVIGAFGGNVLYKEEPKDPFALFHINQALAFQGVLWAVNIVLAIILNVLGFILAMISDMLPMITSILSLLHLVIWAAAIIVPLMHMGKAKNGEWSEMPLVGARVKRMKSPILK